MKLSSKLTEKAFQAQVVKLAKMCHWRVYHTHDSRRSEKGFPDLVLVHRKRNLVLFAELKVGKNQLTPEQAEWLDDLRACDSHVCVWRPENWPEIEAILTGRNHVLEADEARILLGAMDEGRRRHA